MKRLILIATVLVSLVLPGLADAHQVKGHLVAVGFPPTTVTVQGGASNTPYQAWINASFVPTPSGSVNVVEHTDQPGDCNGAALGCTDGSTIWIATWAPTVRMSFMHELGHVFAYQHPALADFTDETFADAYSICARFSPRVLKHRHRTVYSAGSGLLKAPVLRAICATIRATP